MQLLDHPVFGSLLKKFGYKPFAVNQVVDELMVNRIMWFLHVSLYTAILEEHLAIYDMSKLQIILIPFVSWASAHKVRRWCMLCDCSSLFLLCARLVLLYSLRALLCALF